MNTPPTSSPLPTSPGPAVPRPSALPPRGGLQRLAILGLFANVFLAGIKLIAGLVGHSYALVADAVESLTDILGSAVIWGGLWIAAKPPDDSHPYGHGKAEALAGLAVSLMVALAGVGIAVKAVHEIVTPHHAPAAFTLIVLVVVVIVKETLFRVVARKAKAEDSGAGKVDAWHHRADAITSLAAFVGITVALVGGKGYEPADDWAALVAAGIIVLNAFMMGRGPLAELMDADQTPITGRVREVAEKVAGVHDVEKIKARKFGTEYWVDMHVRVNPDMNVRDAHAVSHAVKDAVRAEIPRARDVLIHIEPAKPG